MADSITLNLSEEAWQDLLRAASARGESPEAAAEALLSDRISGPHLSLAGCIPDEDGDLAERHAPATSQIRQWRGICAADFASFGDKSVDEYIEDLRGR